MTPYTPPERDPLVILDQAEARCIAKRQCPIATQCARAKAALPERYASLADYSMGPDALLCIKFLPIQRRRR